MTAQKENPSGASTAKGRTAKPLDGPYSFTTGAEKPEIEARLDAARDAGLINDDGRCVDDSHFGWVEPPEGFEFSDSAVHAILKNRYGEPYSVKIAGRLWVSAHKAGESGELFIEVSFLDNDGKARRVDILRGDLAYPDSVARKLLQEGAAVDGGQARHLARYLTASNPITRLVKESPASRPRGETAKTLCFADVAPEKISWLWFMIIALGKLSLLVGDPGLGKSLVTLFMAARVSLGRSWPDGSPCPGGSVIFISCEDDPADTIRPRLDAAGADVGKVHMLTAVCSHDGKERSFTLDNIPALKDAIIRTGAKLVVIDPISAYLGGADSHNNAEIRGVLAPLSELAAKHRVAIVAVSHLNKGSGQAIYRAMGSLAFTAAARAVWAVVKDKQNPDRRLVLPVKNNIGNDASGLAYKVITAGNGAPCLEWEPDPVNVDVSEAMAPVMTSGGESNERRDAKDWLLNVLADGAKAVKDLRRLAGEAGISWRTIERAKSDAEVVVERVGFGAGGSWQWRIPSIDRQETPYTAKTATQKEWRPMDNLAAYEETSGMEVIEI